MRGPGSDSRSAGTRGLGHGCACVPGARATCPTSRAPGTNPNRCPFPQSRRSVPATRTSFSQMFDAHLHPAGLSDQDLETLRYFGVESALVLAGRATSTVEGVLQPFDELRNTQLPRLE